MSRGIDIVKKYLEDNGLTNIKRQHKKRGDAILIESTFTRSRIQDGARTFVGEILRITAERKTRILCQAIADTITDLLTQGFITVAPAAEIHYAKLNSERGIVEPESNRFKWIAFFEIKGQTV